MRELNAPNAEAAARLLELIQMRLVSAAVHVAAALGVAELLADAPMTAERLAQATGVNASALGRVMRALVRFEVFSEDSAGRFALAPLGKFLQRDRAGSLHPAALFFGGDVGRNTVSLLLECVTTGESAPQKLSGASWIDWLQADPKQTELFNATMTSFAALHFSGVLQAYDFSYATKLVDVGGGHGRMIAEILKHHPGMKGVLFDMPHAFDGGQRTIGQNGLADRCEIVTGDFFVAVPGGADAYLLSRVIHDWDDEKAVAILRVIRRAVVPQGRLVLLETMLRPAGRVYPVLSDLNMLIVTGGRERTEEEYRALYRTAGFELTRAVATESPTGTTVIEGRPI